MSLPCLRLPKATVDQRIAPNSHTGGPPGLTRLRPVAGEPVEYDPVRLDADDWAVVDHQRAGILDTQKAVLRMNTEQMRRSPAEPVRLRTELVEEGDRVRPQRRRLCR